MWYKVNKIRVGTNLVRPAFQLKKIFDFTTQDLHWFSSVTKRWNGNVINTTNQNYVSSWVTSSTLCWWQVQKEVNTTKAWMRIKWKITSMSSSGYSWVWIACWIWDYYQVTLEWTRSHKKLILNDQNWTTLSDVDYSFSTNVYYYIDMKFENWILTCQLLDQNLDVLKTLTYNTWLTVLQYVGFCAYSWVNNLNSFEIKEYRLAYEE